MSAGLRVRINPFRSRPSTVAMGTSIPDRNLSNRRRTWRPSAPPAESIPYRSTDRNTVGFGEVFYDCESGMIA